MKTTQEEQDKAKRQLLKYLKPGSTVYCVLRSVSRSGMNRNIDFYVFRPQKRSVAMSPVDGHPVYKEHRDYAPVYLSGYIANLCGYARDKDGALKVSGCGMDMGFAVVNHLGQKLFGDGYKLNHEWM